MSLATQYTDALTLAEAIAQQCGNARQTGNGWEACCPAHDDTTPSLSITPDTDKILLYCHAGCTYDAIVAALGMTKADLFLRTTWAPSPTPSSGKRIVATYPYLDGNGHVLHETVRYADPKDFKQRRPDPAHPGKYIWSLKGITPVLYHLPDVLAAVHRGEVISLCEGEKDVDALVALGLVATCNPMGADKWRKSYTETLRGADVVMLPDNDTPGRKHGAKVARALNGTARSVKVVELPGLSDHGDVSDWLEAGGTRPELEILVTTAPLWTPARDKDDLQDLLTHAPALDNLTDRSPSPDTSADRAGPYQATRSGLVWWKDSKDGRVAVPLTNFTARIVADVVEDDGVDTRRYFELEACHEGRTVRFPVEANHFAGMTWALEHLGARAAVFPGNLNKDHARMAVQMFSQEVFTRHIYTHLGWRKIDETWCFLHAAGARGADGPVSGVEVNARHTLAAYVLPGLTTLEGQGAALRASLQLLTTADEAVTIPLYAALWRAVLGRADFSLHLVGPTGAGKSELAALVQQHYGAEMTARHLPAAWTSTGNALEALAFEAKDVLLVVDDFCPSGSQADMARFHRDADRLLRAQGNHSGRQRLNRDTTLRAVKPPRGLIVSTGEDTPQGQSLRARILILDVAPDSVQWDTLTPCQKDAADGTYATALAGFVQWLAPHYEQVSHGLQAEITALRQAALTSGHRRTPELVGNLALGIQYLLAYAHDIGALTVEECAALWQRTWKALVKAAEAQGEHQANEEPVRRFLALLTGALAAGLAHIADAHTLDQPSTQPQQWGWRGQEYRTGEDVQMSWQPLGICVGWLASDRLYLEGEAVFSVAQKLAESQKAPLAITQQTLWKRMNEKGLLIRPDTQRSNKAERTVRGERRHVVDISSALILPASDASDASDASGQHIKQNQGQTLRHFPAWYSKSDAWADAKVTQPPGGPPSHQAPVDSCVTFPPGAASLFSEEVTHNDEVQPQQNQGAFQRNHENASLASLASQIPAYTPSARNPAPQNGCDAVTDHTPVFEAWQDEHISPGAHCPMGGHHTWLKRSEGRLCARCNVAEPSP